MLTAFLVLLGDILRAVLAVIAALLPRRVWPSLDVLPIETASPFSGLATTLTGLYLGARGLMVYLRRAADASINAAFDMAAYQIQHPAAAGKEITTWDLQQFSVVAFVAFVFFTPLGLFASYLVLSGIVRAISGWLEQPVGDPLLTGVDALVRRTVAGALRRRAEAARRAAEGPEVPDRLFTGDWAGLEGVDFVVVSSRQKPGWTRGTFVMTSSKWYTLGDPFDLQLPQGLRTVYPLTEQKVMEVLRRGVTYELPPLSRGPARAAARRAT